MSVWFHFGNFVFWYLTIFFVTLVAWFFLRCVSSFCLAKCKQRLHNIFVTYSTKTKYKNENEKNTRVTKELKPSQHLQLKEAPRITEPQTNKKIYQLNKATQGKKKVSLTVHVRFLSINLQYLIFTFGFFTRMRKIVKSAASVFLHLSPWGESCYFTPIFCAKILPTNYVSPRLPFVMFILQKILTNFAHYYGKIQLLAINHLWKACFMLYAICT